ncbi:MAG: dihydrolipoyl dehydrogenase [Candidatus Kapaibacterium sp.]|nr:MAG: dihydrolipoyl dehydrogenase [Candidatus Kapabacteria bacterium]
MNSHSVDVVVVGAGPGGYVAAIRAAQLGMKTICIERDRLGGVCLNWGCIPSKALLKSAEYKQFLDHAGDYGFKLENVAVEFDKVIARSRAVADRMNNGVAFLFKKYKVQHIAGSGKLLDARTVEVTDSNGNVTDRITAKHVIIATGARTRVIPGIEVDRKRVWTSTEAMLSPSIPSTMVVIGSGAIGVEFAYFYNAFGTKVTIVEMMPTLVPNEDEEIARELERSFKKQGMTIMTKTKVVSTRSVGDGVEVVVESADGKQQTLRADVALNAVGVQGNIEHLGLETVGVTVERGWIKVDQYMRTNVEGVYAIGDIAGPPWLAHKASAEGILCVENIAGLDVHPLDYGNIPGCTYCQPQIASIGLTEKKAREAGYQVKIGKFPFTASGKAWGIGKTEGFVKLVIDAKYGEVLGAHMIGPDVTELIAEIGVARSLDATAHTLIKTIHAHPTLSEAVMESAATAYGESVNF